MERVEERVAAIDALVALYKRDWERVLFVLLFKAYGLNVNGTAFYESAQSIPIAVVRKLVGNHLDIEALFMGQSGLLERILEDANQKELKKRYEYVKTKFNLVRPEGLGVQFARLRPSNFPRFVWRNWQRFTPNNPPFFKRSLVIPIQMLRMELLHWYFRGIGRPITTSVRRVLLVSKSSAVLFLI